MCAGPWGGVEEEQLRIGGSRPCNSQESPAVCGKWTTGEKMPGELRAGRHSGVVQGGGFCVTAE